MSPTQSPSATLTPEQLLTQLRWRYATKRFDPSFRIEPAVWSALEQALVLAPSSFGLQPWRFVVVTDPTVRAALRSVSQGQAQVTDASHLVVFAYKKGVDAAHVRRYLDRMAELRGQPRESLAPAETKMTAAVERPRPFDVNEWSKRQVYLALGVFLTSAALLGLDACPMEGIEPARYDEILGLPAQGFASVCVAAVGRRAADDKYASLPKVRFDAREVLTHV